MSQTKICSTCRTERSVEHFSVNRKTLDGLQYSCSPCQADQSSVRKYGIRREQVTETVARQGGCGICGCVEPPKLGGAAGCWQQDHDHKCCPRSREGTTCGQCLRGVLCSRCNKLLGDCQENVDTLLAAIEYLRRWGR